MGRLITDDSLVAVDDDAADADDFRVKELGPGEIRSSDAAAAAAVAGGISELSLVSAQKSDLTLLRNANVLYLSHRYMLN